MTRSRPISLVASAAAIPLVALAVAACGGGGAATAAAPRATSTSTPAPKSTSAPTASVRVAKTSLGSILVDSAGRTLHLFKADSGSKSACTGACATAWPPLRIGGKPTAANGANSALLGTTPRSDGAAQVTYNGHPLYLFVKDHKPGDVNGQAVVAFGAAWFALSRAGNQVSSKSASLGGGSSSQSRAPAAAAPAQPQPGPQPKPTPQPQPAPQPAPHSAPKPAPPRAAKPVPPAGNGIPQNDGGDGDSDNNGGPSDGDGNV